MLFMNRDIKLCLGCMEDHVVYEVIFDGMNCEYCYKTDTLLFDPNEYKRAGEGKYA